MQFYRIFHQFQLIYQPVNIIKSRNFLLFFFKAIQSDDPERVRVAIEETLSRLTDDTSLNENTNLLNLISQRKSIPTPDISADQSTEQASNAENLISSSHTTDDVVHVNRYDTPVLQTQVEPMVSSEDSTTPIRTDITDTDSWMEVGESNDETLVLTNNSATKPSTESGMFDLKLKFDYFIFSF